MSNWDTKFLKKGFTFDDVLLIPAESHVLPNDADFAASLVKSNYRLHFGVGTGSSIYMDRALGKHNPNYRLHFIVRRVE